MRFSLVLGLTFIVFVGSAALAEPSPDTEAPSELEPQAQPTQQLVAPPPESQAPLQEVYERAFTALVHGQFTAAIQDFDQVALQASDAAMRGAARELARLARHYLDSGTRFTHKDAPGQQLTASTLTTKPQSDDDTSTAGRAEFVVSTTLASFYAGFSLNVLLDIDSFRTGALVVTAATAGGFLASLQGSKGKRITGGVASAYSLGIGIGLSNGLLLASPLGLFDDEDHFVSSGLVGMVTGGAGAMILADMAQPTRGQVSFSSTLALLGVSTTGLALVITEPDMSIDAYLSTITAGLDAGLLAGAILSPRLDWSTSRASLVTLSAFLGAVGGFGSMALVTGTPDGDTSEKLFAASVLAGMWGGFGLGIHFTKDMSADKRFATADGPPIMVMPTLIGDAPGLAFMGTL